MSMKSDTEKLVKQVFNDVYGYNPSKVRSLADESPSKDNSYLYNPMMMQFEGVCTGKSSMDYLFFIFHSAESKEWEYSFTPLPKE